MLTYIWRHFGVVIQKNTTFDPNSMKLLPKTALAFGYLPVIRQSTDNNSIRTAVINCALALGTNEIVVTDDDDPAADLRNIELEPLFDAIDEIVNLRRTTEDVTVINGCNLMIAELENVIQNIIAPANGPR